MLRRDFSPPFRSRRRMRVLDRALPSAGRANGALPLFPAGAAAVRGIPPAAPTQTRVESTPRVLLPVVVVGCVPTVSLLRVLGRAFDIRRIRMFLVFQRAQASAPFELPDPRFSRGRFRVRRPAPGGLADDVLARRPADRVRGSPTVCAACFRRTTIYRSF